MANKPFLWSGNMMVAFNKDIFMVFPGGILEIRGDGWGPTRRKGRGRNKPAAVTADQVRICKLGSVRRARRIAEMIVMLDYEKK